jgi:hypothetical protein
VGHEKASQLGFSSITGNGTETRQRWRPRSTGFAAAESWIPGTFNGEGDADLCDVNLDPKPQYTAVPQTQSLAPGAPRRVGSNRDDD